MKKINILFFLETIDGGGAEKVLRNLVNNMDQSRFRITVQTLYPDQGAQLLAPGIRYKTVYAEKNRLNTLRYRVEAALGLLYRLHIRDDYDLECAGLECGATKILSASTNPKAKKLAWIHCDLQKAMAAPEAFAKKTKGQYQKFDKVVCVSQQGKRSFETLFPGMEAQLVYNTVDCEEILQQAQQPVESFGDAPMVVSLGRLAQPKNFPRLLKTHQRLLNDGIRHQLLILGEGPDRPMLEKFVQENALEDTVFMPGFRENPYPYLYKAELLASSSIYECFSTFVTEGLILGKPIVTTDVSGMRELLGDSEYGLITDNDDDAFYEGMKKMLRDEQLRVEYARRAAIRGKDFSTKKLAGETERFLEECLKDRG